MHWRYLLFKIKDWIQYIFTIALNIKLANSFKKVVRIFMLDG